MDKFAIFPLKTSALEVVALVVVEYRTESSALVENRLTDERLVNIPLNAVSKFVKRFVEVELVIVELAEARLVFVRF